LDNKLSDIIDARCNHEVQYNWMSVIFVLKCVIVLSYSRMWNSESTKRCFCFDIERDVKLCSKDVNFTVCKAEFDEKKNRRKIMYFLTW